MPTNNAEPVRPSLAPGQKPYRRRNRFKKNRIAQGPPAVQPNKVNEDATFFEPREPILNGFTPLGLSQNLLYRLQRAEITEPTPIQAQTLPATIEGKDLIGIAQTGTGKTLAFALPIFARLQPGQMALVLAPTRELAEQISNTFVLLGKRPSLLIGGASFGKQIQDLKRRQDIIVATPGRLLDHLDRGTISLDQVAIAVLDEADRMLDLGFSSAIEEIFSLTPFDRQTLLFSATFPRSIADLARKYLSAPAEVTIEAASLSPDLIKQELVYVKHEDKMNLYTHLLDEHKGSVLVFSRTRHGARKLAESTRQLGHTAAEMHSDRTLAQRREALMAFKNGENRVLVATDIAARGIDVKEISLVLNFDLPDNPQDYVHRIGRTGRAGSSGTAITLATPDQHRDIRDIEKILCQELPLSSLSLASPRQKSGESQPKPSGNRRQFRGRSGPSRKYYR